MAITLDDLRGDRRRVRTERTIRYALTAAAATSILISALIIFSLARETWTYVTQVEWATVFTSEGWFPRRGEYNIWTLLVGSGIVTAVAMVVAVPVGLGSAIYLSEYARPSVRKVLKPTLEILAGIPSVVLGFFAISFISPEIVQRFFGATDLFNLMAAGLAVGILSIPLVASVSEDALRSVPHALREASYGMGARKMTTTLRVVVPAAVSGLVAAFILAVSRAVGETMVVLLAAGSANRSQFTTNPFEEGLTMTAAIASQVRGSDAAVSTQVVDSLYFVGFVLFAITLLLNVIADRFVRRVRQAY
jgi:phosphate transport system permease protein